VGPGIGSCCFEVGEEVAAEFEAVRDETTWGSTSVDLVAFLKTQLDGLDIWLADSCTFHQPGWFSHRRDQTPARLATIGWLP
jgi:copper oxidase (laccase) domain-containing protein